MKHYKQVKQILEQHQIDLVHVHNFFPLLTPSVFKAAKDAGAKVVHTLHNYRLWCISGNFYRDNFGICENCLYKKLLFSGILYKCYRKSIVESVIAQLAFWFYQSINIYKNIDYFFVLTPFQKEKVKQLGVKKQRILLKPNSLEISLNLDENFTKDGYIYVGRIEESKGIYNLLKIWKTLDDKFTLTVIGNGDSKLVIEKRNACKNIIFKGKCSREETLKHISRSKYLIQPSILYETFGLTIIEAMSVGVPVIGLNIGTRNNFIQNEVNGFITDLDGLKESIERSYNFQGYEDLSKCAKETAKQYKNEYVISSQIEMYKKIVSNNMTL